MGCKCFKLGRRKKARNRGSTHSSEYTVISEHLREVALGRDAARRWHYLSVRRHISVREEPLPESNSGSGSSLSTASEDEHLKYQYCQGNVEEYADLQTPKVSISETSVSEASVSTNASERSQRKTSKAPKKRNAPKHSSHSSTTFSISTKIQGPKRVSDSVCKKIPTMISDAIGGRISPTISETSLKTVSEPDSMQTSMSNPLITIETWPLDIPQTVNQTQQTLANTSLALVEQTSSSISMTVSRPSLKKASKKKTDRLMNKERIKIQLDKVAELEDAGTSLLTTTQEVIPSTSSILRENEDPPVLKDKTSKILDEKPQTKMKTLILTHPHFIPSVRYDKYDAFNGYFEVPKSADYNQLPQLDPFTMPKIQSGLIKTICQDQQKYFYSFILSRSLGMKMIGKFIYYPKLNKLRTGCHGKIYQCIFKGSESVIVFIESFNNEPTDLLCAFKSLFEFSWLSNILMAPQATIGNGHLLRQLNREQYDHLSKCSLVKLSNNNMTGR